MMKKDIKSLLRHLVSVARRRFIKNLKGRFLRPFLWSTPEYRHPFPLAVQSQGNEESLEQYQQAYHLL